MPKKFFISMLFMIFLLYHSKGCDCKIHTIESSIKDVDIIFTGKVIALLDTIDASIYFNTPENREYLKNRSYTAKVLITEKFKTPKLKIDTLEFTSDYTNCDPIYKLGESYLFFANKTNKGKFKMAACTYWETVEKSNKNIEKLKTLKLKH